MPRHDTKSGSTASLNQKLATEVQEDSSEIHLDDTHLLEHPSYQEMQKKLDEAEEKAERLLRSQADMQNAQRRFERDLENAHKYGIERFVLELLPMVDGLERAIEAHSDEASNTGSLLDGVNMTLKMCHASFEKFGIQQVDPDGQPFNPELHQAVSTLTDAKVKPGTVLSVLQKGYLLNNRLVRPALVVVSKTD